ncbi:MAG: RdgB/HAM1 family non-canonical purine NTP pyrophosphatase [Acidobacteriota bacterium]
MAKTLPAEILIATKNAGKVEELRALMRAVPVVLHYLPDFPDIPDVEETGTTFEQNAVLKAVEYARRTKMWAVADDSGLAVDALGGEPGVYSARYGGEDISFADRMDLVLGQLGPGKARTARFVCSIALADATGEVLFSHEAMCPGTIAESPRGAGGFGYDPIFVPDGYELTFGELPAAAKQQISHRARASAVLIRYLLHFNAV